MPDGVELVRATDEDNAEILEFLRQQNMQAGLTMRFDRAPDYFALLNAHTPENFTWLLRDRDTLKGLCSVCVRPGYVDGQRRIVAYLSELRFSRGRRTAGLWRRAAQHVLPLVARESGAELGYCSIISGNRLARTSLLQRRRDTSPLLRKLCAYSTISIVARRPLARKLKPRIPMRVRPAVEGDIERIRDFLARQCRAEQFGVDFDADTWSRRLGSWPDFGISSFYVAIDREGAVLGCLAPWDSSAINRIVLENLPARAEALRRVANLVSPITRRPVVRVGAGAHLPDIAITHLQVAGRRPEVFAALLDAAYTDFAATRRFATMTLCLYENDPLRAALERYVVVDVPMELYWLKLDPNTTGPRDVRAYPGFEHYLV